MYNDGMDWFRRFQWGWVWLWVAVLTLGITMRTWSFPHTPVSLYWDEMAIVNDALSVAATGHDIHGRSAWQPLFISYGDYKLPVYIWLASVVTFFTDDWFIIARAPSWLAGVSMLATLPLLVVGWARLERIPRGTQRQMAWWSTLGLALLPWSMHFSRVGFEAHVSAAFVLASVAAWVWGVEAGAQQRIERQLGYWTLSTALGVAAVYTYFSTRFVWPVIIIMIMLVWWRRLTWRSIGLGGVAVLIWLVAFIPMLRADFYDASNRIRLSTDNILQQPDRPHEINQWRSWSGNTLVARVLYTQPAWLVRSGVINMATHLEPAYLFAYGQNQLRHSTGMTGLVFWWMAPFFLLGIVASWRVSWRLGMVLLAWYASALIPASVPLDAPHALRSLNAVPVFALWTGIGFWSVWQTKWIRPVALAVFGSWVVLSVWGYQLGWSTLYARSSAVACQDGYIQLAQYVADVRSTYDAVIIVDFDDRFFLYYQPISGIAWDDLQRIPTDGFKRSQFGTVSIQSLPPEVLVERIDPGTLVVLPVGAVPENAKRVHTIYGATGEERFVAIQL